MAGAAAGGAGLSAVTSILGGVMAMQQAKGEAKFLKALGEIEAEDFRRETRRLLGEQLVAFAAAGVDPTVGTPLDVLGDTVAERELGALRIRFGRRMQAKGVLRAGNAALIQGIGQGGSTILGAVNTGLERRDDA